MAIGILGREELLMRCLVSHVTLLDLPKYIVHVETRGESLKVRVQIHTCRRLLLRVNVQVSVGATALGQLRLEIEAENIVE